MNYLSLIALGAQLALPIQASEQIGAIQTKVFTLLTDGKTGILSEGEYEQPGIPSECKIIMSATGEKVVMHIITKPDAFTNGDSDFEEMTPNSVDQGNTEVFDISEKDLQLIQSSPSCKTQDKVPQGTLVNNIYS